MSESKEVEVIDPKVLKKIEEVAINTFRLEMKKDFRATQVHRIESGGITNSEAQLININEETVDETGHPTELDIKSTIKYYQQYYYTQVRYSDILTKLVDWWYIPQPLFDNKGNPKLDENGNQIILKIPIDLPTIHARADQRTSLGLNGSQSWKHIDERKANAGRYNDENVLSKVSRSGFFGEKKERRDKDEMREQYGQKTDQ